MMIDQKKIILNIPHVSTFFPDKDGYRLDLVDNEVSLLTDLHADKIFYEEGITNIIAETSRIYCDVERLEDSIEPMAKFGMGIIYTKTDDGQELRQISNIKKLEIINQYYNPYHRKLTELVEDKLAKYGECLIIDCHTFSNLPFKCDLDQSTPRPDVCIGTDSFHTPLKLSKIAIDHFKDSNLTVCENLPYSGCIVPQKFYQKDSTVHSIMIELNRKLHLDDDNVIDNKKIMKLNQLLRELYKKLE